MRLVVVVGLAPRERGELAGQVRVGRGGGHNVVVRVAASSSPFLGDARYLAPNGRRPEMDGKCEQSNGAADENEGPIPAALCSSSPPRLAHHALNDLPFAGEQAGLFELLPPLKGLVMKKCRRSPRSNDREWPDQGPNGGGRHKRPHGGPRAMSRLVWDARYCPH